MKLLLVGECRDGALAGEVAELFGFAGLLGAGFSVVLVGNPTEYPAFEGRLYVASPDEYGEYQPDRHKRLVLEAVEREAPDGVVLLHSSYGSDLAPRVAASMNAAQISAVTGLSDGGYVVGSCNGKMLRTLRPVTARFVLTLQSGAFAGRNLSGVPEVVPVSTGKEGSLDIQGYTRPESGVDLSRAEVIVSAGRGIGSIEHVGLVTALADALGGEVGASRPVIDAGWLEPSRQIGASGQEVSPALYVACGISGAIQHLAGMKRSKFVLAINTDRDAPIGSVTDVLAVADLVEFLPVLTARLRARQG